MTDCLNVPYAERHIDPDEPGLVAGYTFGEGELAQFGRYLNRARTGAGFDLSTRVGTPLVGQGGGVYVNNNAGSYYGGTNPTTAVTMAMVYEQDALPTGNRYPLLNGGASQHYFKIGSAAPYVASTLSASAILSDAGFNPSGRGPVLYLARHNAGAQELWANGRLVDSDVIAFSAPTAGNYIVGGQHGTTRQVWFHSAMPSNPRASYVREFARRVVYSWTPRDVGEGPAGGIATGAVGEGDWYCPSGGASLAFVYRRNANRLALTDSGALSMRRLSFMHSKMPAFGAWRFGFELRDPATDNPRFGITAQRDQDFTAAGSDGYWWQVQRAAGVMQATMHEANGAAVLTVNSTAAGAAGDDCEVVPTRAVNGDFRLWLRVGNVWAGSEATVANDVTSLSSNYVQVAPRQSYVYGITRHQAEMTPAELP